MTRPYRHMLGALLGLTMAVAVAHGRSEIATVGEKDRVPVLVVIVNQKNPNSNLTLRDLRLYFKLEKQTWKSSGARSELWLRSSEEEDAILLERVYKMSKRERKKYFRELENRGGTSPLFTPTAQIAGKKVRAKEGAFSVVMSDEIPEGVKALLIEGKKHDADGYPLTP